MKHIYLKQYIRQNPNLVTIREHPFISDEQIPDIKWFLNKNNDILHKSKPRKPWYFSKPVLVPLTTLLIIGIFFGVTPFGRAAAQVMYSTVIQWMSGNIEIRSDMGPIPSENSNKDSIKKLLFKNIDDVRSRFNIKAAWNNRINPDMIEAEYDDYSILIRSTYHTITDNTITITQISMEGQTNWSNSIDTGKGQAVEEKLADGTKFAGTLDNGTGYSVGYKENMSIEVYAESTTYNEFVEFIRNLKIE
jgi:hypothetical protein